MDNATKMNLITFNCKNVKRSVNCVRSLCKTVDILLLQETWLYPHDLSFLETIDQDFSYTAKSSVDTTAGICNGRSYGGLAILWRRSAFNSVSVVQSSSDRICAVQVVTSNRCFLVINIYMPTDCTDNLPHYTECLSEMYSIMQSNNTESVFVLGDFNAHPGESFCNELLNFCSEHELECADIDYCGILSQTYTFISDSHGCKRWLDHCIATQSAAKSIVNIEIIKDSFWSDHFPLKCECDITVIREKICVNKSSVNTVYWGERNIDEINEYTSLCNSELKNLDFPETFLMCADKYCNKNSHKVVLDNMYRNIVGILSEAAKRSKTPKDFSCKNRCIKNIKGWNKYVKESHLQARSAFKMWRWYGQPNTGPIFEKMSLTRKIFKSKLKWCIKNQNLFRHFGKALKN